MLQASGERSQDQWSFGFIQFFIPFKIISAHDTGHSVGGVKMEELLKNHLAHRQAELGLSHKCPMWGSTHTRHSGEMIPWLSEVMIYQHS